MAAPITLQDYERAERDLVREEERRGFRIHAEVYVTVNLLLFAINMALIAWTDESFLWFVFPLVCWGAGLAAHYAFGVRRLETTITERQRQIESRAVTRAA
jgi:hypothetical protein